MHQAWTLANGLQYVQETHCRERKQAQKGERVETTAVVQRVMVKTSEYDDDMLIESRFDFVSELTTRGATPPLSPITGSSIEQASGARKYTGQDDSTRWHECFEFEK